MRNDQKIYGVIMNFLYHKFSSEEEFLDEISKQISNEIQTAIVKKGRANLLVSGGKSPSKVFSKLSNLNLDWGKVNIFLCDERISESDKDRRNASLVNDYLRVLKAKKANFLDLNKYTNSYKNLHDKLNEVTFDSSILSFGIDGHVASIFADSHEKAFQLENDEYFFTQEYSDFRNSRISINIKKILQSKKLNFFLIGKEKENILLDVLKLNSPIKNIPLSYLIIQNSVPLDIYYLE